MAERSSPQTNASRRNARDIALFSIATASCLSILPHQSLKLPDPPAEPRTREHYGTLDAPLFKVDESLIYSDFSDFREIITQAPKGLPVEEYKARLAHLARMEAQVDAAIALAQSRKNALVSGVPLTKLELCDPISRVEEQLNDISESLLHIAHPLDESGVLKVSTLLAGLLELCRDCKEAESYEQSKSLNTANDLPPEAFVRALVKEITHRNLPDEVQFRIGERLAPGLVGLSNFLLQEIKVEDGDYIHTVLTCAHEVGHLIAQHSEEFYDLSPRHNDPFQVRVWEEACAFAFEFTVASHLHAHYPEYADRAKVICRSYHYKNLRKYYNYTTPPETIGTSPTPHHIGMAFFDAAWEELGSCAAAYNYLSSHTELTPGMQAIISRNRSQFDWSLLSEAPNQWIAKIQMARKQLQEKIDTLATLIRESAPAEILEGTSPGLDLLRVPPHTF